MRVKWRYSWHLKSIILSLPRSSISFITSPRLELVPSIQFRTVSDISSSIQPWLSLSNDFFVIVISLYLKTVFIACKKSCLQKMLFFSEGKTELQIHFQTISHRINFCLKLRPPGYFYLYEYSIYGYSF